MNGHIWPGPWVLQLSGSPFSHDAKIVGEGFGLIASVHISASLPMYAMHQRAHARLLVTAPELLKVLDEAIHHEWNPFEPDNQSTRYRRLVALRVKATGSSQ